MPPTTKAHSVRLLALAGVVLFATLALLDYQRVFSEVPYSSRAGALFTTSGGAAQCGADCPPDPFTAPGMIHWSATGQANETRWLPFPRLGQPWDDAGKNVYELAKADAVPSQAWESAAPQVAAALERGEDVAWLKGRTVLFIDDRNNVQQLCEVIRGKYYGWGNHIGGYCHDAARDLVLVNWFLFGMVDVEDKFPGTDPAPHVFEGRFEQVFVPKMAETGLASRGVDLAVVSSLFWDALFFSAEAGAMGIDRAQAHGILWHEAAWFRARIHALFAAVRTLYPAAPVMFRTRQIREVHSYDQLLRVFQLDQAARAVAKEDGVALFTWGEKLEGYTAYYDHDQHFALGPNTYLFGDMTFFYLRRAITPGCWRCRERE
ncbi:uncharacterized protein LOC62_07G009656 [Vanrija pseudolonga]|uniref:Uncharacterized protein n=1 Tax=Vanrija pseudolonga TaxID=143232 RepID=A0AAF0YMC7_9TREE|nr:hypothetical protein LOC62_07G009656 [Vanrija pseudolonga]